MSRDIQDLAWNSRRVGRGYFLAEGEEEILPPAESLPPSHSSPQEGGTSFAETPAPASASLERSPFRAGRGNRLLPRTASGRSTDVREEEETMSAGIAKKTVFG